MGNIVEVLAKSDKFKGVTDAIKIAGLVELLSSKGPFTILAPHDEAVAQVPRSYFRNLISNRKGLAEIVKYHILQGEFTAKDIENKLNEKDSLEMETLSGEKVSLRFTGDLRKHYTVNKATIVSMDLRADNGVIHTLDTVLFYENSPI